MSEFLPLPGEPDRDREAEVPGEPGLPDDPTQAGEPGTRHSTEPLAPTTPGAGEGPPADSNDDPNGGRS